MFRKLGITAMLLASAALFMPAAASAQNRYDRSGYGYYSDDRHFDKHDRNWNRGRDRHEYLEHERREHEWRERERFINGYRSSYLPYGPEYGYYYSNPWQCR